MSQINPEPHVPQLLRVRRAAMLLDRSMSSVYGLIRSGEIAVVKVGGSVRVPADALRSYVERNTTLARSEGGGRNG